MVFMTVFDIYGRILNRFGLKQYQFDVDYAEEKVIEGKYAIDLYKEQVMNIAPTDFKFKVENDDEVSVGS
jgi:hypothetical protein